jgi:hypothetical protein
LMMMRCMLLIVGVLLRGQFGIAQVPVIHDTATVSIRQFAPARINEYKSHPDFQYEPLAAPSRTFWDRFWEWFWQKAEDLLGKGKTGMVLKYLLVAAVIGVSVFFVLKLSGMSGEGLFGKSGKRAGPDYSVFEENIHTINFDQAIQQAIEDRNYRFAIRLLYLQSLKNLADRELISWQINKTNIAYVQELKGHAYEEDFRYLTAQFEFHWYGEASAGETGFHTVKAQFDRFNKQLQ